MAVASSLDGVPGDPAPEPLARRWASRFELGGALAILAWVFVLYANVIPNGPWAKPVMFVAIFGTILGYYPCIWIHELGHAGAALLVRWRVIVFAVRPLAWHLRNRELVRMLPGERAELGGYVFAVPSDLRAMSRRRHAIFILGGPALNILFGAAAVWAAIDLFPLPNGFGGDTNTPVLALGIQSLHLGIGALIPSSSPRVYSDGQSLLSLARSRDASTADWALHWAHALSGYKIRLADLPTWLIEAAERGALSEEGRRMLSAIEIGRMLDAELTDLAGVRAAIDAHHARFGDSEWLAYCDAYLAATCEADGARASERLWQGERHAALDPLRLAVEASVAARMGYPEAARLNLDQMDKALAEGSAFSDPTFRDIRRNIEAIA